MVCLGLEPGVARWKAQTNPLSTSGTPTNITFAMFKKYTVWMSQVFNQSVCNISTWHSDATLKKLKRFLVGC